MIAEIIDIALVELLEESSCGVHAGADEVLHLLRAAGDAEVGLCLHGRLLHHVVGPLRVGESDGIAAVAELLYDGIGETVARAVVLVHLIVEHRVVVAAGLLDEAVGHEDGEVG